MRALIAGLLLALLAGCATVEHRPLAADAAMQLKGKLLVRTSHATPDFIAMSPAAGGLGLIGALAAISEGAKITRENGLEDPAQKISTGLADRLVAAHGMRLAPTTAPGAKAEISDLAAAHPGAEYLLDVQTLGWMMAYLPTRWGHYRVSYSIRMRLIETASKSVISETLCRSTQGDEKNPPTWDQLLENRAALLKDYTDAAARGCVDVLARDVLKL